MQVHISRLREKILLRWILKTLELSHEYLFVYEIGTCQLTLIDPTRKKCIVTLDKVLFVLDLALRSNGQYRRLLSVPVATIKKDAGLNSPGLVANCGHQKGDHLT